MVLQLTTPLDLSATVYHKVGKNQNLINHHAELV